MSIVVAVQKRGQIHVASDSQSNYGQTMRLQTDNVLAAKLQRVGASYIGHVGHGLYEDLLNRFVLGPDKTFKFSTRADVFDFFVRFYGELQKAGLVVNTQPDDQQSPFAGLGSEFIVASTHGIFYVCSDMGTTEVRQYIAIGSGRGYALGALHALYGDNELSACTLALAGVKAAMAFDVNCGGEVALFPVVEPIAETLDRIQDR